MSLKTEQEQLPRRSSNIFINYRREDSAGHAGRLFDRLSGRFPGRVFMDIDTIQPGIDFVDTIEHAVSCCEVLIVVIGRDWLFLTDATGRRRLDNPNDFVRLEIAAALERNIRIIPVLVEGAPMPRPEDLPPDLARLTRRNAIELSDARWAFDVDRLIQAIEGVLQEKAPSALLPAVKPPVEPVPNTPVSPVRERRRSSAWLTVPVLALLSLAGWSQLDPRSTEKLMALVSLVVSAVQTPPANPEIAAAPEPSEPTAAPSPTAVASPEAKATETTHPKKGVDGPQPGTKESPGRFGSLVRKWKGAYKNLRGKGKQGASAEG